MKISNNVNNSSSDDDASDIVINDNNIIVPETQTRIVDATKNSAISFNYKEQRHEDGKAPEL